MFQLEQLTLLHRHGEEWRELSPAAPSPDDYDLERRVLRGARLYRCQGCETQILVASPEAD